MYHRKTKKKLDKPYSPIATIMLAINRRQTPLCAHCLGNVSCKLVGKINEEKLKEDLIDIYEQMIITFGL
jgi:hypothetical protein